MSANKATVSMGEFGRRDIFQSALGDFNWSLDMYDGDTTETPSDLAGRAFGFKVFDVNGDELASLEVDDGIEVSGNNVSISIALEDWAEWKKNCDLKYNLVMTLVGGTRYPLFSGKFRLTT
jgi:hypothetical protein